MAIEVLMHQSDDCAFETYPKLRLSGLCCYRRLAINTTQRVRGAALLKRRYCIPPTRAAHGGCHRAHYTQEFERGAGIPFHIF